MAFFNCRITSKETAINFLIRLEQKANEARNYEIKISEHRFLTVLLNNMKHHSFYKERIAAILTNFELNPTSLSQPWIENKFYSIDEERLTSFRSRLTDSARYTNSSNRSSISRNTPSQSNRRTSRIRCKYCYSAGHTDTSCQDKSRKRPPSVPIWISNLTCAKCKKKGRMAINCPPKYDNKIIKRKNTTPRPPKEKAAHTTEFAGAVHVYKNTNHSYSLPHSIPPKNMHSHYHAKHNTQRHSKKIPTNLLSTNLQYKIKTLFTTNYGYYTKKPFLQSLYRIHSKHTNTSLTHRNNYRHLVSYLHNKINSLNHTDALTILWCLSKMMVHQKHKRYNKTPCQ